MVSRQRGCDRAARGERHQRPIPDLSGAMMNVSFARRTAVAAGRKIVLGGALMGTTAIVGVTLASPAAAQTTVANPREGGSITIANNDYYGY